MREIEGDLLALALSGAFDVIVHGCNCIHTMGAGIAKPIAQKFPEVLEADRQTPYGTRDKLGTLSTALVERDGARFTVVNAYTQFDYRGPGVKVSYPAISACFERVAERFADARIGYPLIGAGLAGGDWQEIAPRIDKALHGLDHCLVVLPAK